MNQKDRSQKYIGGEIFTGITIDHRVKPGLQFCVFCHVCDEVGTALKYEIPLTAIDGSFPDLNAPIKMCPACKRIYILTDSFIEDAD